VLSINKSSKIKTKHNENLWVQFENRIGRFWVPVGFARQCVLTSLVLRLSACNYSGLYPTIRYGVHHTTGNYAMLTTASRDVECRSCGIHHAPAARHLHKWIVCLHCFQHTASTRLQPATCARDFWVSSTAIATMSATCVHMV